ncbi:MAG: SUMF1/EgtB/PvdO family nonheme iron enzyme [Labilithrix sp.]|nr:SUMF1/EgtB/PvdO family nonheme iron enzyme [Labilithrix sp.]
MKFGSLVHPRGLRARAARRVGLFVVAVLLGIASKDATSSASGGDKPAGAGTEPPRASSTLGVGADAPRPPSIGDRLAPSLLPGPGAASVDASDAPATREWQLVQGRHWQIRGPAGEERAVTDAREKNRGACAPGMIEVAGNMKRHFLLDELQMQACTNWIDRKWPQRCAEYDRDKWLRLSKDLPTQPLRFCIDRFEYPNRKDEYPIILVSWYEARDACAAEGKRLCTEDEWTFACEGEEAQPYPNGYVRDPEACLNDRPWKQFDDAALRPRSGDKAKDELDRLWQGHPSGARPLCKSPFGVYDMTGNIDEWTRSSIAGERPSVLKGGYWGPVRTRCRPATKAHDESHVFYQQGFRCCSDPT